MMEIYLAQCHIRACVGSGMVSHPLLWVSNKGQGVKEES